MTVESSQPAACPRTARAALLALSTLVMLTSGCAWCTDVQLAQYRDDKLLAEYRYALGEEYLEVDGINFCYQEQGREHDETVVILPGLGTSADFWELNIPVLAEQYHVLAIDIPGFGKSDKPDASYELPWLCERLLAFLDAKGVQRASFIGGSMGGHLGLLLALDHADRVEKLVMTGACGGWPEPDILLTLGFKVVWSDAVVTDHLRRNWPSIHERLYERHTPMTERIFRHQMAVRAHPTAFKPEGRASARALKSIFYNTCRHRLADLEKPVLLIWGEEDFIHLPKDGVHFRAHFPNSRLVIVPGAAHEVMVDKTEIFNSTVLAFLKDGIAGVQDSYTTGKTVH